MGRRLRQQARVYGAHDAIWIIHQSNNIVRIIVAFFTPQEMNICIILTQFVLEEWVNN